MTRRIALRISYDGTAYAGWQTQSNAVAVQQVIEKALSKLSGGPVGIIGASRTDAGVHAQGQVAHFDTETRIPAEKFSYALNTMLPEDIRIVESWEAAPDFHARFGTAGKVYAYTFYNAPHASAMLSRFSAHCPVELDVERMNRAAQDIVGVHDFSAFMASGGTSKTFEREMKAAQVCRAGNQVCFMVWGTGFLYNMVRITAGTLALIGQGKLPEDALARAIASHERLDLGYTAPAKGLTLMRVLYPGQDELAREILRQKLLFNAEKA